MDSPSNIKKINSLIVILFVCYWLFVFISHLFPNSIVHRLYQKIPFQLYLFPLDYKMYVPPPKTISNTEVFFYKKGQKMKEIDQDKISRLEIEQSKNWIEYMQAVENYSYYFSMPNLRLANWQKVEYFNLYKSGKSLEQLKAYDFKEKLKQEKTLQFYYLNQVAYYRKWAKENHIMYDSAILNITRKTATPKYYKYPEDLFEYYLPDSLVLQYTFYPYAK